MAEVKIIQPLLGLDPFILIRFGRNSETDDVEMELDFSHLSTEELPQTLREIADYVEDTIEGNV